MKRKKIFFGIFIIIIVVILLVLYYYFSNLQDNSTEISDYTPEEEISDEQLRETILTLYFLDIQTNSLKSEGRLIDAATLVDNPYLLIVQLLIDGPKSDSLESVFPSNTRIIDASIDENCVTLNFSNEILNYEDDTQKYDIINSILNSLAQLNEVDSIKILVNGETVDELNEEYCFVTAT